jgi:hypothetical protein
MDAGVAAYDNANKRKIQDCDGGTDVKHINQRLPQRGGIFSSPRRP